MAILPGATIGFLGGGQLGRMAAMAARSLGYGVAVLDPDPRCPASAIADRCVTAPFDDAAAAEALARGCAVVTYEIEKIPAASLARASVHAPVRPSPELLGLVQDRARQKRFLRDQGFPVGPYAEASSASEAREAFRALGGALRLKACQGGYDGRGQARAPSEEDAARAFDSLGGGAAVAERELELAAELSVLVARRPSGELRLFPVARNWLEDGILRVSVLPGELPAGLAARAQALARGIAERLSVEGLLAVEFFLTRAGELFVNELAPRPHNTFHATEAACPTSQFEQLVRAICDLPLGATSPARPTALVNLLGDLWLGEAPPALDRALELPGVRLYLYGKEPRAGRKIGHLLAVADGSAEALALVREASARLSPAMAAALPAEIASALP
ncbi:MAG: 5-(carboxyamino)imidazole ribonucleotide synthase [Deltaproteobacteria bacterium]